MMLSSIETEEQLNERLTRPSQVDLEFVGRINGDVAILGAGGKMGPTLARRLRRAVQTTNTSCRVLAVSRFSSSALRNELEQEGIETISCDLMDPTAVAQLPAFANVLFLAGKKFGSAGNADAIWAMNTIAPANVVRHFQKSRIVVFSTGNVYPFVPVDHGASMEHDELLPRGEYAQSCLGRERIFEYYSQKLRIPCLIFRLNYAIDLRYGVLVDIARQVYEDQPVDLSVPAVNVIWQGDANSYAIRSLALCSFPLRYLNVTGPETLPVRQVAEFFAERFGRRLTTIGGDSQVALLSNAGVCHSTLGYPEVPARLLMEWVARWIEVGGPSLNKATKFHVTDGKF